MDIEHFEAICEQESGTQRTLEIQRCGVRVELVHAPDCWPHGKLIVLFEVGQLHGRELEARTLMETLLDAGIASWQRAALPMLGCHPDTGAAMLQCIHPLLDPEPGELAALIEDGVALALELREDFLAPA